MIRPFPTAAALALLLTTTTRGTAQMSGADSALLKRADHARIEGSPSAKVWLVEMSDFQCPYCRNWHDSTYGALKKEYVDTGKIRIAYINFPLSSIHKNARAAARVAMCAAAQDKFWPMHDALFTSQASWEGLADPAPVFDALAKKIGVDMNALHACLAGTAIDKLIDADIERARDIGVRSTPSFSITGQPQLIAGAQPADMFRLSLDAALATAAKP